MQRPFLATVLCLLVALEVAAQSVTSISFDPSVVRPGRKQDVTLKVVTTADVSQIRVDRPDGTQPMMTVVAPGSFTLALQATDLTGTYVREDVGRAFVGFLRLLDSNKRVLATYNAFITVRDDTMPSVAITEIDATMRMTPHVLNIRTTAGTDLRSQQAVAKQFYRRLSDDYDFLHLVYALPSFPGNRNHRVLRNQVLGIGLQVLDDGASWGSAKMLTGVTSFPIDTYYDLGEKAASHEIGHQWVNYLQLPETAPGPHWPPSSMAHHLMGFNIAGSSVGGDWPWRLATASNGDPIYIAETALDDFSNLDLYLMGLMTPGEVGTEYVVTGGLGPCAGCVATVVPLTVDHVIATVGPRSPAASYPRTFRIGTVVITNDRLLNDDELTAFDYFTVRGESTVMLPSNTGLAGRTTVRPFHLATHGRASLDTRLTPNEFIVSASEFLPRYLPTSGGSVTVHGTGFNVYTSVTVGGKAVDTQFVDGQTIRFTAPARAHGSVEVVITSPGKGSIRVPDALVYGARRRAAGIPN